MKKIHKPLYISVLILCITIGLTACGNPNSKWLNSADSATLGYNFSLQEDLTWGMTAEEVVNIAEGPFEDDYETYLSMWMPGALPADDSWKVDSESVNIDAFKESETLCYYTFNDDKKLFEYGYYYFSPTLVQYDFLKEYYTKKYGEPKKEEYIWNDESYKPDGNEDLYKMFNKGEVKVLTVWDLSELDSILVVDWLSDSVKEQNNFGQISFYEKNAELNLEDE